MAEGDELPGSSSTGMPALLLVVALRCLGGLDMLAFVAVVMPTAWIEWGHRWCGLGEFPDEPIANYLARSASALYALHGLLVLYMSRDPQRYWPLIRFFARLAVAHGVVMFAIDWASEMPLWWTALEGPAFTATGLVVLATQYWSRPDSLISDSQMNVTGDSQER
ncbi:MAG: hypothetical protein H6822_15625 [Planctomycetaceae bacterium]|nr:hypothetical protein [Planctomycetales bacterium]MCB9923609.1 hypothetical protein [Planctomycetaceae bacterium]